MKSERDVEKGYSTAEFVAKLWRLADAWRRGELEFHLKWSV